MYQARTSPVPVDSIAGSTACSVALDRVTAVLHVTPASVDRRAAIVWSPRAVVAEGVVAQPVVGRATADRARKPGLDGGDEVVLPAAARVARDEHVLLDR